VTDFLQRAVDLATAAADITGGPFGALIVVEGEVIAEGTNRVTTSGDPTAHAEIVAIRAACDRLGTHMLDGGVLYSSCEPCPMCLAAAWWARVARIEFAASRDDAAAAGFDDSVLYTEVAAALADRTLPIARGDVADALAPFATWAANSKRVDY